MRSNVTMSAARGSLGGFLLWHGDHSVGTVALGEVVRPEICWGASVEKRVMGMVSHGIALGQGLLNRLVLLPLEGKTPGAGD